MCQCQNPLELNISLTFIIFNIINILTDEKCDPLVNICDHFIKYSFH
jgi:hypothetical protein